MMEIKDYIKEKIREKAIQYCVDCNYIEPDAPPEEYSLEAETAIDAFIHGYEENNLTWEDIRRIGELGGETLAELGDVLTPETMTSAYPTEEAYYSELLRRFNKYKNEDTPTDENPM